jgi:hypothetical protein
VIFGAIQGEFEDTLRATGILRGFTPGSRNGPVTFTNRKVQPVEGAQYASAERIDWLQMAPYAWSDKPVKSLQEMAPVGVPVAPIANDPSAQPPSSDPSASTVTSSAKATPQVAPDISTSTSSPAPAPATESAAAAAASATVSNDEEVYYQQFEKRLKALSKLRDHDVITEKEYQERRRAILEEL